MRTKANYIFLVLVSLRIRVRKFELLNHAVNNLMLSIFFIKVKFENI